MFFLKCVEKGLNQTRSTVPRHGRRWGASAAAPESSTAKTSNCARRWPCKHRHNTSHMKDMGPTCVSHKPHMYHMCQATSATRRTVGQLHCMTAWLTSVASLRIFSPNWSIHFGTITLHTYTMLHSVTPFLVEKAQCFIKKCQKAGGRYGERGERNSLGKRASENLVRQRARFCDATWRQLGFIFFLTLSMSLRIEVIRCKAPLVLIHSSVWTYDIRL